MALKGLAELLGKHKEAELTAEQFEAELNKILPESWKPANIYNELNEKYKALEKQNGDYAKAIEEAEKNRTSVDDLNKVINDLKAQHKAENDKRDADFAEYKKNAWIDSQLEKAGALNSKATKALLDSSKIALNANGEYLGLDEQIKALKDDASTKFLFKGESPKPEFGNGGTGGSGQNPTPNGMEAEIARAMGI